MEVTVTLQPRKFEAMLGPTGQHLIWCVFQELQTVWFIGKAIVNI